MLTDANCPPDFRLTLHHSYADSYQLSKVLLARAGFDGTLELMTSGWEHALGYQREEFDGRTLRQLMWSNRRSAEAAVAAILYELDMEPVDVRVRCKDGLAKGFRLHRHYDRPERLMYLVAEEIAAGLSGSMRDGEERRFAGRTG